MTTSTLASATEFAAAGYEVLVRDLEPTARDRLMLRASRHIESRCNRRLVTFTTTETHRANGVDPHAAETGGWPLDLIAALGQSRARAYASTPLVRDVWLNEYAARYPDLWAYTDVAVALAHPLGGTQTVTASSLLGPRADTGHLRFALGTNVPIGTEVTVTYGGGYTTVPDDLNEATILQAAKYAVLTAEPQLRKEMSLAELNDTIAALIEPYKR